MCLVEGTNAPGVCVSTQHCRESCTSCGDGLVASRFRGEEGLELACLPPSFTPPVSAAQAPIPHEVVERGRVEYFGDHWEPTGVFVLFSPSTDPCHVGDILNCRGSDAGWVCQANVQRCAR